ncbi:MAG: hypothetical protein KGH64_04525 [Candidatus Micrarchaeota archaeon]|nr:hypothetical protein [Candidatus Micrarchaeota archaeon]
MENKEKYLKDPFIIAIKKQGKVLNCVIHKNCKEQGQALYDSVLSKPIIQEIIEETFSSPSLKAGVSEGAD